MTPDRLAIHPELYTRDGKILWGNLPKCGFPGRLLQRIRFYSPSSIIASLRNPASTGVLLEVNFGQHWVLADRKTIFRMDFICADPFLGRYVSAIGDYHVITGSAHLAKL